MMLEEYILEQLQQLEIRKESLKSKLNALTAEEEQDNEEITKLMGQEDIGVELFSPRFGSVERKKEIDAYKQHIEQLRLEQTDIRQKLEEASDSSEQYQALLLESREKTKIEQDSKEALTADNDNQITLQLVDEDIEKKLQMEYVADLEKILQRVERCYDLSHQDKIKCRNELKNLRYYMKALISKTKQEQ